MEAKNQNKKLSYEQLSKALNDIHLQYNKLMGEYQKAMEALRSREFDYTSFFLSMLFKVMEHPDMYTQEFVKWCSASIEAVLPPVDRVPCSVPQTHREGEGRGCEDNLPVLPAQGRGSGSGCTEGYPVVT